MKSTTGPKRGRDLLGGGFWTGTALLSASRTIRRCTPNLQATPLIVPTPNSYSRLIASNNSTLAFLLRIDPPYASQHIKGTSPAYRGWATRNYQSGPNQSIKNRLLRDKWKESLLIGGFSFLAPFLGALAFAYFLAGWNLQAAEIAGGALST